MKRSVRLQHSRVIKSNKDASQTENSQYWESVIKNAGNEGEEMREAAQANPDMIADNRNTEPSSPQFLMGEAIQHLQGRQREVYFMTMREDKSFEEVAAVLGIHKSSVQNYRARAIRFIIEYCQMAIERGRV